MANRARRLVDLACQSKLKCRRRLPFNEPTEESLVIVTDNNELETLDDTCIDTQDQNHQDSTSTYTKNIFLESVDFVASPSAIYLNSKHLQEISDVDIFFDNLDKEINNSKDLSPQQLGRNVMHVKAIISSSKNEDNNNIRILDQAEDSEIVLQIQSSNNSFHNSHQDIKLKYTEIPTQEQIIIPFHNVSPIYEDNQIVVLETINVNDIQIDYEQSNSDKAKDNTIANVGEQFYHGSLESEIEELAPENGSNFENSSRRVSTEQLDSPSQAARKKKTCRDKWKDIANKKLKNSGQSYISVRSNKTKQAKLLGTPCSCKKKCFEKIDEDTRKIIFKTYWEIGDHERQWDWILRYVTSNNIKKMQLERKNNRTQTLIYKLPIGDIEEIVCKKMFTQTLGITEKVIYTAIEKKNALIVDNRGKHTNRPHKMSEDTEKSIREHIESFPTVESHYTRKRSSKLYLSENLNISKMYRLYTSWFPSKDVYRDCKMGTKSQYELIFNTRFNMAFFKPKKDLCELCSIYTNADEERKLQLQEKYLKHLKEKEEVRKIKDLEKNETDNNSSEKTVACFDLEKVLQIPQSEVGIFYYKRKFSIYNLTIYDLKERQGYCFLWNQQVAKRGAIEIGSCLWDFIKTENDKGKKEISLYSDACTGQNRNRFIFALYLYASKKLNISISHRFFVSGHSQSEGDMMHSCIERAKKHQTIYTPEQMYFLIENSKVNGNKFILKEMTRADFYDLKKLVFQKGSNWTEDCNGEQVYWSKIREVVIYAEETDIIYFKYGLEEPAKSIKINRVISSRRKKQKTVSTGEELLQEAYSRPVGIPALLHKDLMSLCNSGVIPTRYQTFYKNLITQNSQESHENPTQSTSDEEDNLE